MPGHAFTIEELMLDDSFVNYCLSTGTAVPSRWKKIIRDHPSQEKTFEEAKRLVLALHGGLSRPEINRQIEIVRQHLEGKKGEKANPVEEEGPPLSVAFVITKKGQIKKRLLKKVVYSAVAFCIMATAIIWSFVSRPVTKSTALSSQPVQVQNYHSALGQRQKVTLPDGSFVILNSNSSIRIAFTNEKREIFLKGDAFFRAAKDVTKPFIVYTENIAATALGTEFYVQGREDDKKNVQVDLLEGRLQMVDLNKPAPGREIILRPGERGVKYGGNSSLEKHSFDSLHLRSWVTGRIYFNETPVVTALKQLEGWYGIQIKVSKADLKNRFINGEYIDEPLQNILDMICFSINSRYSIKDNRVIIE
jgi:ferric-dicitrate binding protein FerR (iron transport regulator)